MFGPLVGDFDGPPACQGLQHKPVMVVQVEHLELALETALAQDVYISELAG